MKPSPSAPDPLAVAEPAPAPASVVPGSYPAAIILLIDGASNTGPRPLEIIEQASNRGVRVYTVGLGSQEGAILMADGFSIRVRLDEETLKRIAEQIGAQYFKAESETDLSDVYGDLGTRLVFKPQQTRTHGSVHRGGGDISAHRRDTLTIVVPPAALIRALVTGSEGISRVPRTVSRGTKKPQGHKLTISDASPSLFQEPGQLVRFRSVPSG